jgi:NHLM bacteriocin system ABC transporter ATP-binding protein
MGTAQQTVLSPKVSNAEPKSNLLSLHDPGSAWMVESGTIDLFLIEVQDGIAAGHRNHILRLIEGEAAFSLPAPATGNGFRLFAVQSPNTVLRQIPIRRFQEVDADGATLPGCDRLIEGWIEAISTAIAPSTPPKSFTSLYPGSQARINAQTYAAAAHDVVWARHVQGKSCFLGSSEFTIADDDGFFPLSSSCWIEALDATFLDCIDTAAYLKRDAAWTGFNRFQDCILPFLERRLQQESLDEISRRSAMQDSDRRAMHTALKRLAASLTRKKSRTSLEEIDGDPLIAACQIAGSAAGIPIRGKTAADAGIASGDPLREIARASGVRLRKVLLRGKWWKEDHGPLVGFWQEGMRPAALIPVRGGYEWHTPGAGERGRVHSRMSHDFSPSAYCFYRPLPEKKLTSRAILTFGLRNCGREINLLLFSGMLAGIVGLLTPILTGRLFDQIIPGAQRTQLFQMAGLLVAGTVGAWMFDITRNLALLRLQGKMGSALQPAVWDRLLRLPVSFFRNYNAGDLSDRANGIDAIRSAMTGTISNSVIAGLFSIFHLLLMFYYSWKLSVVAILLLLIAAGVTLYNGKLQTRRFRLMSKISGQLSGQALQLIGGVAKIRVSGVETRAFSIWSKCYAPLKSSVTALRTTGNAFSTYNALYLAAGPMAIFYAMYDWSGRLSAGDFLAFNSAFGSVFSASMQLAGALIQTWSMKPIFERALPLLHADPEVDESKINPGVLTGEIEISRIVFRYQKDGPEVIRDISLRIEPGQFIALVGPSGCGKSTLFRLLLGFERPESGAIYYNGQDLNSLDLADVRRQMGVVLQNSLLFRGDLFSNIVGSRPLTLDDAWEAAKLAGVDADIRSMPMGMHSVVTEGGGGISGGQRQRLIIARAIVNRPRILLFDEATSALDNQTQSIVSRSLEGLKATRIVIAHRLSTIINADMIFVLDQGKIIQSGTYRELMAQEGLFAELAKRQIA